MLAIDQGKIQIRFRRTPSHLQELIFDEKENDIIDAVGQEFGLDLEKKQKVANVCLLVFLGFLSINDVGKEIAESAQLDRAVAEKISGKLYDRIFSFVKEEIQAHYKPEFTPDEEKKVEPESVIENTSNEAVFLLNSLAPLEKSLSTSHPEATPIPPKPETKEIPTTLTQQEAPITLYSESEIVPLKETIEITGPASLQGGNEVPKAPYAGPASIQFGGFEIPKPALQEKKVHEIPDKNITSTSIQEFVPKATTEIKNTAPTPTVEKKEILPDIPKFIALEADSNSQIHTPTIQIPSPTPQTTQKPAVVDFTEKPPEPSTEEKAKSTTQTEAIQKAPQGLFGKLSSMVLGLGEKPAPIQNRTFGPPTINAKVIDYGMPKPEQPQQTVKETERTKEDKTPEFFTIPLEPTPKKQETTQTQDPPTINPVVNLKKPTTTPPPPLPPYKN